MLKIFHTQLHGSLQKIIDKNQDEIENAARLLAQAVIANGKVVIIAEAHLQWILDALAFLDESIPMTLFDSSMKYHPSDRFIIVAENLTFVEKVQIDLPIQVPFILISNQKREALTFLSASTIFLHLQTNQGLVISESGERKGNPYALHLVFIFQCIQLTLNEILSEYKEEDL